MHYTNVEIIAKMFGVIGIVFIVVGANISFLQYGYAVVTRREMITKVRHTLGDYILIGLDFLIAQDIILTVAKVDFRHMMELSAIIAIRLSLAYLMNRKKSHVDLTVTWSEKEATLAKDAMQSRTVSAPYAAVMAKSTARTDQVKIAQVATKTAAKSPVKSSNKSINTSIGRSKDNVGSEDVLAAALTRAKLLTAEKAKGGGGFLGTQGKRTAVKNMRQAKKRAAIAHGTPTPETSEIVDLPIELRPSDRLSEIDMSEIGVPRQESVDEAGETNVFPIQEARQARARAKLFGVHRVDGRAERQADMHNHDSVEAGPALSAQASSAFAEDGPMGQGEPEAERPRTRVLKPKRRGMVNQVDAPSGFVTSLAR